MDRAFLEYYEEELEHIRALAAEFADLHPAVARNLSLDTVPCPDPYVERLLEGVAFLAARTRLKLDGEGARFARAVLDALYPDLVAPTPAVGMAVLQPGQQVQTMLGGHVVKRGRTVSLQEERVVRPDWTVRWQNGFLQLSRETAKLVQPGERVILSQQLDGRLRIFAGDLELAWTTACVTAAPTAKTSTGRGPTGSSQGQKPSASHPWRRRSEAPVAAAAVGLGCSTSVAALPSFHSPTPQQPR